MTNEAASAVRRLKLSVDRNACCGYGACKEICPEIFDLERGLVTLKTELVPAGLEEKANEAVESCPQAAIAIETVDE